MKVLKEKSKRPAEGEAEGVKKPAKEKTRRASDRNAADGTGTRKEKTKRPKETDPAKAAAKEGSKRHAEKAPADGADPGRERVKRSSKKAAAEKPAADAERDGGRRPPEKAPAPEGAPVGKEGTKRRAEPTDGVGVNDGKDGAKRQKTAPAPKEETSEKPAKAESRRAEPTDGLGANDGKDGAKRRAEPTDGVGANDGRDGAKRPPRVLVSPEARKGPPKGDNSRSGPVSLELAEDDLARSVAGGSCGSSMDSRGRSGSYSSYDDSRSRSRRRKRRQGREALRGAGGFSAQLAPPPPPGPPPGGEASFSSTALALPEKVRGLLDNRDSLALEVARMKQAMQGKAPTVANAPPPSVKLENRETAISEQVLRMPPRLHENLLHPDNEAKLLARTGLLSASLNEDGLVVLRAASRKGLIKALGTLRRVAYHCQWGCTKQKVAALLADKPARPINTMVVRLAATSSRLQSFEARLTLKVRKLRIGTQAGACQMVVEGIPGLSRKHCTITFEPEKGACYVQDLSTNGTYFNGKRLPRPPYKNPQDARVRVFHGDELFFRLRSEDTEELGYVVNLVELS